MYDKHWFKKMAIFAHHLWGPAAGTWVNLRYANIVLLVTVGIVGKGHHPRVTYGQRCCQHREKVRRWECRSLRTGWSHGYDCKHWFCGLMDILFHIQMLYYVILQFDHFDDLDHLHSPQCLFIFGPALFNGCLLARMLCGRSGRSGRLKIGETAHWSLVTLVTSTASRDASGGNQKQLCKSVLHGPIMANSSERVVYSSS